MPKPPVLPILNWKAIFGSGKDYESWLRAAENPEHVEKMEVRRKELKLDTKEKEFLKGVTRTVNVVAIAEDWCGDVVRHVPVLQFLKENTSKLNIRYLSRDHPDIFIRFLTNGGEAIPRFIFLNDEFVECGNWGPMPMGCRDLIARGKACNNVVAARKKVAALYEADVHCKDAMKEILHLIDIASTKEI